MKTKGNQLFTQTPAKEDAECSSGCCSPKPKGKKRCPLCGEDAKGVPALTLVHLLTDEARMHIDDPEGWYYCKTPSCEAVYFKANEVLVQEALSVPVGLKEGVSPAPVCYCFGWTKEKISAQIKATGSTQAIEDIKAKMQDPGCDCERLNPSGSCCLGDVGKVIKALESQRL